MTESRREMRFSNPDVIYWINELNSYFFRVKVYKFEDGEKPVFSGDPINIIRNIASAEHQQKEFEAKVRGITGTEVTISQPLEEVGNILLGKELGPIISTLRSLDELIVQGKRDEIKIEDIQKSQEILYQILLVRTGYPTY